MAKFGKPMSSKLSDPLSGLVRATGPSHDQGVSLAGPAAHLQEPTEALVDDTALGAQRHRAPMRMVTPWRAPPLPLGLVWASLGRRVAVCWAMWFPPHRGGRATWHAQQGYTQTTQPWPCLPRERRNKPIQSLRRLARWRHDPLSACHQDHRVVIAELVAHPRPWPCAPAQTGREKTVDRPITPPVASPTRPSPPRHAACH